MDGKKLLSMPIEDLLASLKTSQSGLSTEEAENRLLIYGYNELAARKRRTGIVEFIYHLRNPLVLILLLAGLVSGFLGDVISASIIFSIVLLSVILSVSLESKA